MIKGTILKEQRTDSSSNNQGGGIYGKRSAWTRADGGGKLVSRRNKKARDFTHPFSINLHFLVLILEVHGT